MWTIRPGADQRLHDRRMPFGGGPHQRGLSARSSLASTLAPAASSAFTAASAGARGRHQRCLAAGQRRVGIGAGLQQQIDHRGIAVGARQRQRRDAVAIGRADLGAGLHQQLGHLAIVVIRRPVQRGHAIDLRRVDVGALLDERPAPGQSIFSAASASVASAAWSAPTLTNIAVNANATNVATGHLQRQQFIDLALAVGERIHPDAGAFEQRQVQVGERCRFGVADVPAPLTLPAAAGDEDRQVDVIVDVGVAIIFTLDPMLFPCSMIIYLLNLNLQY